MIKEMFLKGFFKLRGINIKRTISRKFIITFEMEEKLLNFILKCYIHYLSHFELAIIIFMHSFFTALSTIFIKTEYKVEEIIRL